MVATPSAESATPIKVLYVEDDQRLAKLTTTFLESRGLVVARASTGPKGAPDWERALGAAVHSLP